jgi:hypothetical protein
VSLLELNAWEDEWLVAIDVLQKEKRKTKKVTNKGWRKRNDGIRGQYTNACKGGVQIKIVKKILKTIQVDHNTFNF